MFFLFSLLLFFVDVLFWEEVVCEQAQTTNTLPPKTPPPQTTTTTTTQHPNTHQQVDPADGAGAGDAEQDPKRRDARGLFFWVVCFICGVFVGCGGGVVRRGSFGREATNSNGHVARATKQTKHVARILTYVARLLRNLGARVVARERELFWVVCLFVLWVLVCVCVCLFGEGV